jgi:hypothetical protein
MFFVVARIARRPCLARFAITELISSSGPIGVGVLLVWLVVVLLVWLVVVLLVWLVVVLLVWVVVVPCRRMKPGSSVNATLQPPGMTLPVAEPIPVLVARCRVSVDATPESDTSSVIELDAAWAVVVEFPQPRA